LRKRVIDASSGSKQHQNFYDRHYGKMAFGRKRETKAIYTVEKPHKKYIVYSDHTESDEIVCSNCGR
jgi:hypothetical protein